MATSDFISIAFFGATGGCANACLTHALKAGYRATALARTPEKLINLLQTQDLDASTIQNNLTIIQGDVTDITAVKRTVAPEQNNGRLVSVIVSGVGGTPKFQTSLTQPVTLVDPHICEDATNTIIAAVKQVQQDQSQQDADAERPVLTVISTTGISDVKQDVPLGLRPLYHFLLPVPHADKRKMEQVAFASVESTDTARPFKGVISVRPTMLTGDHTVTSGKGWQKLRAGIETEPAVGYGATRADVGEWIFEQIVRTGGGQWLNQKVSLTY